MATRTYKERVPLPDDAPLTRIGEIEDVFKEHGPVSWRIEVAEMNGTTRYTSLDEAMAEMPDRDSPTLMWVTFWATTNEGIEASMLFMTNDDASVEFSGRSQTIVLGCAAAWKRRLERPAPLRPQTEMTEPVIKMPFLSTELLPRMDAPSESSLLRRAFNNPWVVGAVVGLVIAILIAVLLLVNH